MNVEEAKELKEKLEKEIYAELIALETQTGFEVAAVLVDRMPINQMGERKRSCLTGLEIVVGIDVPATPKEAI